MMFRNVQLKVKQAIGQDPWLSFPTLPAVYFALFFVVPICSFHSCGKHALIELAIGASWAVTK
jgi:hypothetical protein